jgi:hypothetical protein
MKMRYVVLLTCVIVVLASMFLFSRRPTAKDFCFETRGCSLSRIEFDGQGRRAVLSDPSSLTYLCNLPKLKALPVHIEITNGYSFETKPFDRWGKIGMIETLVSSDASTLRFSCPESLFGDATFSFATAGSNAPIKYQELIRFLLDDKNQGKCWIDGGIRQLE